MNQINYFKHETSFVDDQCKIGSGTKIWHFSHIMQNSTIGKNCNIGQNVVVSPQVVLGDNVKIQNNVSVYTGVKCENDVFQHAMFAEGRTPHHFKLVLSLLRK